MSEMQHSSGKEDHPAKSRRSFPEFSDHLDFYQYEAYPKMKHFTSCIRRIMKEKGMDELFYAIRKLHKEYGKKVVLDIVGFFEDEYKGEVEKLVEDGIAVFHGFKEDPRPYYKAADCIVLPLS